MLDCVDFVPVAYCSIWILYIRDVQDATGTKHQFLREEKTVPLVKGYLYSWHVTLHQLAHVRFFFSLNQSRLSNDDGLSYWK